MFWNNFYQLCESKNLKPLNVVKELGIATGSITKWKNGTMPSMKNLEKIATYFGVSVDYLFAEHNNTEKPSVGDDDELEEYLEELKNRPEMKMLFSLAKGATKQDVEQAVAIIEALRKGKNG